MNYNRFGSEEIQLLKDKINSRAKLDTGTHCNYECSFCYYIDQLDKKTSLDIIKARAKKIRDFGIEEVDMSGGESSIHDDWFEILEYCRDLGFKSISCLSNGSRFANLEFLRKSQAHGLSEILFSLHGWDTEGHDHLVGRKGSFKRMLKAIANAKELGVKVRINCTVTGYNGPHLQSFVDLVNDIGPAQVNFLPLNYWQDAHKVQAEKYEELSSYIKEAIPKLGDKIEVNVRYIPFCFMEGFEKYVVGVYQHIFDQKDWNIMAYDIDDLELKTVGVEDYYKTAYEKRLYTYTKSKKCFDCKYFHICDGVEKKIADTQDVYPVEGDKIKDIQFFRREYYPEG